jgi:formylmethanofuran dehydrogenase subunit E
LRRRKKKYRGAGMKHKEVLLFDSFLFHYGRLIPFEALWEDGAVVWGYLRCDCCGREVDKAVLLNGQYHCESCLEKKVQ